MPWRDPVGAKAGSAVLVSRDFGGGRGATHSEVDAPDGGDARVDGDGDQAAVDRVELEPVELAARARGKLRVSSRGVEAVATRREEASGGGGGGADALADERLVVWVEEAGLEGAELGSRALCLCDVQHGRAWRSETSGDELLLDAMRRKPRRPLAPSTRLDADCAALHPTAAA